MTYADWERDVPDAFKDDSLCKMTAYRLALFMSDLAWRDITRLASDPRTPSTADQLYRACGAISAHLAEGYSRSTSKERARFYEFSLGSTRETRDWYFKGRHLLTQAVFEHRMGLLVEISKILLTMVPDQRTAQSISPKDYAAREEAPAYATALESHMPESLLEMEIPFELETSPATDA